MALIITLQIQHESLEKNNKKKKQHTCGLERAGTGQKSALHNTPKSGLDSSIMEWKISLNKEQEIQIYWANYSSII